MSYLLPSLAVAIATIGIAACSQCSAGSATAGAAGTAHLGAPERSEGWWEFAGVTSNGRSMGKQNLCVTSATEARFSAFDQITQEQLLGYKCSKADFRRAGSGWEFDVACDTGIAASEGGGIVISQGKLSGDFQSSYEIHMTVKQAGETHSGVIKARRTGSCPSGRKPGDLVIDDSETLNVLAP
jgi:hypothetical protein